jgi:hypothetical protein
MMWQMLVCVMCDDGVSCVTTPSVGCQVSQKVGLPALLFWVVVSGLRRPAGCVLRPNGRNGCDMVTGVTIKAAREARLLAGTRAREARPKQRTKPSREARPEPQQERENDEETTSKIASKSRIFSGGRASRAALRARS